MSDLTKEEIQELYHKIIKSPYKRNDYTWYELEFKSLFELYQYLKSNPKINENIFKKLSSSIPVSKNPNFYEMEYNDALEILIGKYSKNIDKLLELKKDLSSTLYFPSDRRKVVKSFTGSRICPNSFITNNPKRYYKLERALERKFITLYVNLGSPSIIPVKAVLNRGALLYNLIDILEENNYSVELKTFFLYKVNSEIVYIKVRLKDINERFSLENGIFPLISTDFQRRIIFRVIETLNITDRQWGEVYGYIVKGNELLSLLSLSDKDIYIAPPEEIGITGENLNDDIDSFLKYVNIKKYVKANIKY